MPLANDPKLGQSGTQAVIKALRLPTYTVATAPNPALYPNRIIRVTNGNSGGECLAYSNGTNWLRVVPGAAISATV